MLNMIEAVNVFSDKICRNREINYSDVIKGTSWNRQTEKFESKVYRNVECGDKGD